MSKDLTKMVLILAILLLSCGCGPGSPTPPPESNTSVTTDTLEVPPPTPLVIAVDTFPIMTEYKLKLMKDYYRKNYGLDRVTLDSPRMVVIHYTVSPTLRSTLNLFKRDELSKDRTYIRRFSPLNVSIHYVIDRDGSIHTLMPDSLMARHIIGFNHMAFGIENVAMNANDLTAAQLSSNLHLVRFLKQRHPGLEYLIGHMEYNDTTLAHFQHFTSLNPAYRAYGKQDPGPGFMQALRDSLATYGLYFAK